MLGIIINAAQTVIHALIFNNSEERSYWHIDNYFSQIIQRISFQWLNKKLKIGVSELTLKSFAV